MSATKKREKERKREKKSGEKRNLQNKENKKREIKKSKLSDQNRCSNLWIMTLGFEEKHLLKRVSGLAVVYSSGECDEFEVKIKREREKGH